MPILMPAQGGTGWQTYYDDVALWAVGSHTSRVHLESSPGEYRGKRGQDLDLIFLIVWCIHWSRLKCEDIIV